MKIGFDFDGVIFDSERSLKFYADYCSYFHLGKDRLKEDEASQELCFDWTNSESDEFFAKYYDEITRNSSIMVGAKEILTKLKEEGNQIYLITLRGYYRKEEITEAEIKLKDLNVEFDEICWAVKDKVGKCEELGLQVMVDDNPNNIDQFKNSKIKVLYFKEEPIREVNFETVSKVDSWMDIYREVKKLSDK